MKFFSLLTSVSAAALLVHAPVHAQAGLDNVMSKKVIHIAVPTDYPPYGYVGPDLKPIGLDVEMATLIAQKLGVKLDLVPVTSANRIPYLQTKKADLVISTLGKNAEREKVIDFTAAYSPFFQAVFGPENITVKTPADLVGKTVAVTRGAMEDQELAKFKKYATETKNVAKTATLKAAITVGLMKFTIFFFYTYSMYIGSIYILDHGYT